MRRTIAPFVLLIVTALLTASCKDVVDLAKYKDTATALVSQYGPRLRDLAGKLDGLSTRAKAIPPGVPGAEALNKLLADNKDKLGKLQGLLDRLPGATTDA